MTVKHYFKVILNPNSLVLYLNFHIKFQNSFEGCDVGEAWRLFPSLWCGSMCSWKEWNWHQKGKITWALRKTGHGFTYWKSVLIYSDSLKARLEQLWWCSELAVVRSEQVFKSLTVADFLFLFHVLFSLKETQATITLHFFPDLLGWFYCCCFGIGLEPSIFYTLLGTGVKPIYQKPE